MKKSLLLICFIGLVAAVDAQDNMQASMEKKARELHRVLGVNDKEQWKKFMKENYTKAFLERPVKSTILKNDQKTEETTTTSSSTADNLEEKARMFQRLHDDFGKSKIISLKSSEENIDMVLENTAGLRGNFEIKFEKAKPYLIDGVRIQVN